MAEQVMLPPQSRVMMMNVRYEFLISLSA